MLLDLLSWLSDHRTEVWIVLGFLVVIAGVCWACYELSRVPMPEGRQEQKR